MHIFEGHSEPPACVDLGKMSDVFKVWYASLILRPPNKTGTRAWNYFSILIQTKSNQYKAS